MKHKDAGTQNLKIRCLVFQFVIIIYFLLAKLLAWGSHLVNIHRKKGIIASESSSVTSSWVSKDGTNHIVHMLIFPCMQTHESS